MALHDRQYEVYVLLGSPAVSQPWAQSTWRGISQALGPLLKEACDRPAVRSAQLRPGPGSPDQRAISFGRIGWGELAAKKWTHKEDGQLVSGDAAEFVRCEVWAPSWRVCHRGNRAPDVYFGMRNEAGPLMGSEQAEPVFHSSCCVLAVARDLSKAEEISRQSAQSIALNLKAVLRARTIRPWGFSPEIGSGYTNAINDLMIVGLFKLGTKRQSPIAMTMLRGTWEAF